MTGLVVIIIWCVIVAALAIFVILFGKGDLYIDDETSELDERFDAIEAKMAELEQRVDKLSRNQDHQEYAIRTMDSFGIEDD